MLKIEKIKFPKVVIPKQPKVVNGNGFNPRYFNKKLREIRRSIRGL